MRREIGQHFIYLYFLFQKGMDIFLLHNYLQFDSIKTSVIFIHVSPRTVRPTELRGSYCYVTSLSFSMLATAQWNNTQDHAPSILSRASFISRTILCVITHTFKLTHKMFCRQRTKPYKRYASLILEYNWRS